MIQIIGEILLVVGLMGLFLSFFGSFYAINHCVSEKPEKMFNWIGIIGGMIFLLGIILIIRGGI